MKTAHLSCPFLHSGSFFDLVIDHDMVEEACFIGGIANMTKPIKAVAATAPTPSSFPGTQLSRTLLSESSTVRSNKALFLTQLVSWPTFC